MKSYIIESGHNSNNYYRKYSDGFIEQWGTISISGGYEKSGRVTFLKTFTTLSSISILVSSAPSSIIASYGDLNLNGFTGYTNCKYGFSNTSNIIKWYACGY